MPRPRAFDHEHLKQLVFTHPDWTDQQFADALTATAREGDPLAPQVNVNTVSSTLSRSRHTWEKQAGAEIPNRIVALSDFMPPPNSIAAEHRNDTPIRYLREVAKDARGMAPKEGWQLGQRAQALKWRDATLAAGEILDLSKQGVPFIRSALAEERNEDGSSKAIAAWLLPGWRGKVT